MNKISKKIVALATMAAFVLTLVPAAAFAAGSSVTVDETEVTIDGSTGEAEVTVTANIDKVDVGHNVLVWAEKGGALYRYADFEPVSGTKYNAASNTGDWRGVAILDNHADNEGAGEYQVTMKLKNDGDYTIWVASNLVDVDNPVGGAENPSQATKLASASVHVNAATSTVTKIDSKDANYNGTPDGVKVGVQNHEVTVFGEYAGSDDEVALANKEVTISAPAGFTVTGEDVEDGKATTDSTGKVTFDLIADKTVVEGTYTITLSCEDVTKYITVTVDSEEDDVARTIEAVDTDKDIVSTDDKVLSSVAQFVFKNAAGDIVPVNPTSETDVRILAKGENYNGDFDVVAVPNNTEKHYTLQADEKLTPGKYTVRVALNEKDSIDLTFTVEKFGKVVDSKIVVTKTGSTEAVTNVYEDAGEYTGTIYLVDENGLEKVATGSDLIAGVLKGKSAVKEFNGGNAQNGTFTFTVEDDSENGVHDNAQIGTDIVFMAFSKSANVNAQATVTVADIANTQAVELAFDSEAGEIGKYNTVNVTVVDANGDVVKGVNANGTNVSATVVDQAVEDANVQATMGSVENGKAELKVYSDKETTADILVVVKDVNSKVIYAGTLTYAFGPQDIPVGTTVVMTIGSSDFVINDEVITKEDSAPYVANDRTYVPFRALGEALGAEVVWDNDARTVTYTLGNTEVVLTIDETTYTVNGDEKTMDVAPVITGDRTYVPVRFVGEALGFSVTALYDTNGATASVVFQK